MDRQIATDQELVRTENLHRPTGESDLGVALHVEKVCSSEMFVSFGSPVQRTRASISALTAARMRSKRPRDRSAGGKCREACQAALLDRPLLGGQREC
jgi:hypothetical protein